MFGTDAFLTRSDGLSGGFDYCEPGHRIAEEECHRRHLNSAAGLRAGFSVHKDKLACLIVQLHRLQYMTLAAHWIVAYASHR